MYPARAQVAVLCKVDIEGHEVRVLPHLVATGALCVCNQLSIEWHLLQKVRRQLPRGGVDALERSGDDLHIFGDLEAPQTRTKPQLWDYSARAAYSGCSGRLKVFVGRCERRGSDEVARSRDFLKLGLSECQGSSGSKAPAVAW